MAPYLPVYAYLALWLLSLLTIRHFLADYLVSTKKTLGAMSYLSHKMSGRGLNLPPLTVHCLIRTTFTAVIFAEVGSDKWWLLGVDFLSHLAVDFLSSRVGGVWPSSASYGFSDFRLDHVSDTKRFWVMHGLDQTLHQLTDIFIVWRMMF